MKRKIVDKSSGFSWPNVLFSKCWGFQFNWWPTEKNLRIGNFVISPFFPNGYYLNGDMWPVHFERCTEALRNGWDWSLIFGFIHITKGVSPKIG